jgi:hypothetical protein
MQEFWLRIISKDLSLFTYKICRESVLGGVHVAGASPHCALLMEGKTPGVLSAMLALNCECSETHRSLDQLTLSGRWTSRKAAVRLECAKHFFVGRNNGCAAKNKQSKINCTLRNCVHAMFLVIREQHQRHDIAYLEVERSANFIQHLGERRAGGNQFQYVAFAGQGRW